MLLGALITNVSSFSLIKVDNSNKGAGAKKDEVCIAGISFVFIIVPDLNHYYTLSPSHRYMIKVVTVSYLFSHSVVAVYKKHI